MTKADVIKAISQRTGSDTLVISQVVESFFGTVKDALADGNPILIRGFGSFRLKKRAQKVARNITRNEAMLIEERLIPTFKPADDFLEKVRQQGDH